MTPWGTYLVFEVSSAEPDADPDWVDFTDRVLDISGTLRAWLGRDSELDEPEPGGMSLQLRNRDDALTPGNPSSPYYPWWKQARRCRLREIIGYLGFDLADGYLEIPEVQIRTQDPDDSDSDVTLTVTVTDILGRLQNAGRFMSTLAEHIRFNGGPAMVGYWPLGDPSSPVESYPSGQPLQKVANPYGSGSVATDPTTPSLTFRAGVPLPGDDLTPPDFQTTLDRTTIPDYAIPMRNFSLVGPVDYTLSAGQVLTLVAWIRPDEAVVGGEPVALAQGESFDALANIRWEDPSFATWIGASGYAAGWDFLLDGAHPGYQRWVPAALRFGFSPQVCELWIGDQTYTATPTVTSTADVTFDQLMIGRWWRGQIAHVQVYIGDATDWTREHFTAQHAVGLTGLERQTTGERINTVLDYAGFPAGRRDVDAGAALMQTASLAGKRPLEVLEEAQETEQGRLFAQGGRVVFHDRRRVRDV